MAQAVVDQLQPVVIDQDHRRRTGAGQPDTRQRLGETVDEQGAVGQVGQSVMQRHMGQPVLGPAAQRHVFDRSFQPQHLVRRTPDGAHAEAAPDRRAFPAEQRRLEPDDPVLSRHQSHQFGAPPRIDEQRCADRRAGLQEPRGIVEPQHPRHGRVHLDEPALRRHLEQPFDRVLKDAAIPFLRRAQRRFRPVALIRRQRQRHEIAQRRREHLLVARPAARQSDMLDAEHAHRPAAEQDRRVEHRRDLQRYQVAVGEFRCALVRLGVGRGDHAVLQDRLEVPGIIRRLQDQPVGRHLSRCVDHVGAGQRQAVFGQEPDAGPRHVERRDSHLVDLAQAFSQVRAYETGVARQRAQC